MEKNNCLNDGNILQVKMYNEYINSYKHKIKNQKKLVYKSELDTQNAKNNLVNASKDKKIYEKLKENYKIDFNNFLKNDENKLLDQITSYNSSNSIGG